MSDADVHRLGRGTGRSVLTAIAGSILLAMVLGGCVSEPQEAPTPVAEGGTAHDEDPIVTTGPSPGDGPTPTVAPAPTGAPSGQSSPSDDPTTPSGQQTEGPLSTDGWKPPVDPAAEGPTGAPVLPEVHGALEEDLVLPTGIEVSLVSLTTTTIEGKTPGEYSGSAVVVEVRLTNGSEEPQFVDSAVVSLVADDGEAGVPTWASPYAPFQGEVPAGGSADGTYVFMLDPALDRAVSVSVNPAAGEPIAVFAGETS